MVGVDAREVLSSLNDFFSLYKAVVGWFVSRRWWFMGQVLVCSISIAGQFSMKRNIEMKSRASGALRGKWRPAQQFRLLGLWCCGEEFTVCVWFVYTFFRGGGTSNSDLLLPISWARGCRTPSMCLRKRRQANYKSNVTKLTNPCSHREERRLQKSE